MHSVTLVAVVFATVDKNVRAFEIDPVTLTHVSGVTRSGQTIVVHIEIKKLVAVSLTENPLAGSIFYFGVLDSNILGIWKTSCGGDVNAVVAAGGVNDKAINDNVTLTAIDIESQVLLR